MAENKTQPTDTDVDAWIDAVPDERRRADARTVRSIMERITGWKPKMWGPTIVGFGTYEYTYETGRTGTAPVLGFSPRKANLVIYTDPAIPGRDALIAALGKTKTGVSCVYVNRLADVDPGALEALLRASLASTRSRWTVRD